MVLYNVPGRTVADMQPETTLRLAQIARHHRGQGSHRRHRTRLLAHQAGAGGVLHLLGRRRHRRGADVAGRPRQRQRHRQRGAAGDARAVHGGHRRQGEGSRCDAPEAAASAQGLFVESSPAPTKWAMARLGLCGARLRLPITPLTPAGQARWSNRPCVQPAALTPVIELQSQLACMAIRSRTFLNHGHWSRAPTPVPPFGDPPRDPFLFTPPSVPCRRDATGHSRIGACSWLRLFHDRGTWPPVSKVDYRSSGSASAPGLDVPPDLTQAGARLSLPEPGRRRQRCGLPGGRPAAVGNAGRGHRRRSPAQVGDVRIERMGNQRWLVTPLTPESVVAATAGLLEGQRLQRSPSTRRPCRRDGNRLGREPRQAADRLHPQHHRPGVRWPVLHRRARSLSHTRRTQRHRHRDLHQPPRHDRGLPWPAEGPDRLGSAPRRPGCSRPSSCRACCCQALASRENRPRSTWRERRAAQPARARVLEGQAQAALQIDDSFERAWRRVGLALDRSGFTVEDRDRGQGLYFVRYVDPVTGRQGSARLLRQTVQRRQGREPSAPSATASPSRENGENSTISVLDAQGAPESGSRRQANRGTAGRRAEVNRAGRLRGKTLMRRR